jgi:hypothetical protein
MPRFVRVALDGAQVITDTRPLAEAKAERIAAVKDEARRRILAIAPEWKQANLTARAAELTDIKHGRALTGPEQAEEAAIRAVWSQIKAIRTASDTAETAINASGNNAAVEAVPF